MFIKKVLRSKNIWSELVLKNLTIIGGSGFIGKSYIDAFNKGLFKKYKLKKINIVCRNPIKLKKINF